MMLSLFVIVHLLIEGSLTVLIAPVIGFPFRFEGLLAVPPVDV